MRLAIVALLALMLALPVAPAMAAEGPCSDTPTTWHHDGGKSIPFENELRVRATDGCHTYDAVSAIAADALNGKNVGSGTIAVGPSNYPWDTGSTVPDPGQVGYCQYAAAQTAHGVFKYRFGVPDGRVVTYSFDCGHPAG